ncbi:hypothetical protein [Burkholderia pseudomallei]|uniref:hypothetical protein n=1 Tax=Burkholderia pseudomallei TaxID=28450 RepID=UPI000A1A28D6|nr:hypothetical protein [Burkholderia pseudomallei]ARK86101.1 hypothetical protein BOC42_00630 [Burkholderia pseudomallei]
MSDPILTPDEIDVIYERVYAEWEARDKCSPNLWVAFAAAVLEKVCGEPVGILSVHRFRKIDSMVNRDFEYTGSLPDGSHQLYALTRSRP